jgi:hypothetical protein
MEEINKDQLKEISKKLYSLKRNGFINRQTEFKDVKFYDGEPYLEIKHVNASISFITKYSYMDTDVVLWL